MDASAPEIKDSSTIKTQAASAIAQSDSQGADMGPDVADQLSTFAKTAQRVLMVAMMSSPLILSSWVAAEADPLLVQGASTVNRQIMEPFHAEIERLSGQVITVIPNRSTLGLIALLEGRAHIAMISASLESEVANLQRSMPGMPFD